MSTIRLLLTDKKNTLSGLIPSRAIGVVLLSLSESGTAISDFWKKCKQNDPDLEKHFKDYQDQKPIMEGFGDGLIVLNFLEKRIESFQEYEPIRYTGHAIRHDGEKSLPDSVCEFAIPQNWEIIDHIFEEN